MTPPRFAVTVRSDDRAHVVALEGELDLDTRHELEAALDTLRKPPTLVALDLSALALIDSTGLKTILDEHHRARAEGYELAITGAQGVVRQAFRITALDLTLPLADDLGELLSK